MGSNQRLRQNSNHTYSEAVIRNRIGNEQVTLKKIKTVVKDIELEDGSKNIII